jgi:hypothetical protein
MADNGTYEAYVEALRTSAGLQDETRITQGEIAFVIAQEYGQLKQAAIDAHIEYKSLSEYRRVVAFYQISAGQIVIGKSDVRKLIERFDTLRYTHLRTAMQLRDYEGAIDALEQAATEAMTPQQFKRYVARERKRNGHKPTKIVIDARAGYRLMIARN